ncbi:MAG TPA: discoidin domain-containing protein [Agriterribacter sp.]|nr:discoidin domain-containing protein [Agriterribacter sp.]
MVLKFYPAYLLFFFVVLCANVASAQTNLAVGRPVTVSSTQGGFPGANAVDGSLGTRWSSAFTDNEWIYVDLGQNFDLSEVRLTWETAYGVDFNIEVSDDAISWTVASAITGNASLNNTIPMTGYTGRYVRMNGTLRATQWGYSLFEFEIYGTALNLAYAKPVLSSSNESAAYPPENAVDANATTTRWSSAYANNQWIAVDLGDIYDLTSVVLRWETALGRDYNIEVSVDGVTWVVATTITNNATFVNTIDMTGTSARYVRMFGLVRGTQWGFSLYELEVYGDLATTPPPPMTVNLAYMKPGTSSSNESGAYVPAGAFDGLGTNIVNGKSYDGNNVEYPRWASVAASNNEWLSVDLGAVYEISEVRLFWEVASANDYEIQVSEDGITWTTASTVTDNPATTYTNIIPLTPVPARYVRMQGITRNTGYGYSLYEFQVYGLNTILPIILSDFSVVKKDKSVQLLWNASMDTESRFNIQRSANGIDFTTIGSLYYPTGTNGLVNKYNYVDETPLEGANFYRLEYTETGGATLYSDIVSVRFAEQRNFLVAPNPVVGNVIRVELDRSRQTKITLRLVSITGKVIEQQEFNSDGKVFNMRLNRFVAPGSYILQVIEGGQSTRSKQVLIK